MISRLLVRFYRWWHGRLHCRGAGFLLSQSARILPGLRNFPLRLGDGTEIPLDFRDVSSWYWMNFSLGESFEEEGLLLAMRRRFGAASVVWDIGANAGLLSYRIARHDPPPDELRLFEPNPRVHAMAVAALRSFGFAHAHRWGLSNVNSTLRMVIPAGGSTCGTLMSEKTERQGEGVDVPCVRGDDLVLAKGFRAPDLIKIDTEGHEAAVLAGLSGLIAQRKPAIFFEHISLTDAEIFAAVPSGYVLYSVDDRDGTLKEGLDRARGHNSLLLPGEAPLLPSEGNDP